MAQGAMALVGRGVVWAAVLACAGSAQARQSAPAGVDFVARANAAVVAGPGTQNASKVLFPALAAMDTLPDAALTLTQVSLMTPSSPAWGAWEKWATAPAQKAALEALGKATDPKIKYVLGLPYGAAGVDPAWVKAGLFVDLSDPPLLARAANGCDYLIPFERLSRLSTFEATRLASSGDGAGAFRVLLNWGRLARITADRLFDVEKDWAFSRMSAALERMRDVAYLYPDSFKEKDYQELIRDLDARAIGRERIKFPEGERLACQELIARTIAERGGPKEDAFSPTLGRVTVTGRPFGVFSEAAQWSRLEPEHAGWFDVQEQLDKVYGDWVKRWDLNSLFDELMRQPTDYSKMDRRRFAMLEQVLGGMEDLFDARSKLFVDLTGTRTALAVMGYRARQKVWPPSVSAVAPQYVAKIDDDPWSYDVKRETWAPFQYFVPMRDQPAGPRELPKAHAMTVVALSPTAPDLGLEFAVSRATKKSPFPPFVDNALRQALASGVPSALFKGGVLDLPGFKTFLKDEVGKLAIEPDTLKNLREQVIDKLDELTALTAVQLFAPGSLPGAKAPSIDPAVMQQMRDAVSKGLPPEITDAVTGRIDVTKFKAAMIESLKVAGLSPEDLTRVQGMLDSLDQQTLEAVYEMVKAAGAGGDLHSFNVELTDKQFVLYSVGPDGQRNYAKVVGVGGQDILMWPPAISLLREHMASEAK